MSRVPAVNFLSLADFSLEVYSGALSWRHRWTITASFRNNLSFTFSHLSDFSPYDI